MSTIDACVLDPRFEPLVDHLATACEVTAAGVQFALFHKGKVVVDAVVGTQISTSQLAPVLSVSKGMTGLCIARMVDQRLLDPGLRVSYYWPEFGRHGKSEITVDQALSHAGGLPLFEVGSTPEQWLEQDDLAAEHLAAQSPLWRPGAALSYHPVTIGTLAGELTRRVAGVGIPEYFDAEIRRVRALDAYLGVPTSELSRVLRVPIPAPTLDPADASLSALVERSLNGVFSLDALANDPRSHRAGNPAAGGVASARGLAELYAAAMWDDGHGLIFTERTREHVTAVVASGRDLAGGELKSFGLLFQKPTRERPFASASAFGHEGAGGAMAYADPTAELAFAFVPSRDLGEALPDELSRLARGIAAGGALE